MTAFNLDGIGQVIRVNFNQDISTATAFSMKLLPENGDEIEVTPTLGTSDTTVDDQTYLANEFVEYTTTDGLFDDGGAGRWQKKATATLASSTPATNYELFRVMR